MHQLDFDQYCSAFREINVAEVRTILELRGLLHERVWFYSPIKELTAMPVEELLERFTSCSKAKHIHVVTFQGGPPGDHRHFSGTLLTYVLDRLLWKRCMRVITDGKHLEKN